MISPKAVLTFIDENRNYMNSETIEMLAHCAETMENMVQDRERLRRENEALRLDIHFLDNGKKGLY